MTTPEPAREINPFTMDHRVAVEKDFRPKPVEVDPAADAAAEAAAELAAEAAREDAVPKASSAVVSADSSSEPGTPSPTQQTTTQPVEHPSQLPGPEVPVSVEKASTPTEPSAPLKPPSLPAPKAG